MKKLFSCSMLALALTSTALLAGCNTWQGVKEDAKEVSGTVTNAVGTGLDKAGDGLNTAGEKVKNAGSK
jgi:predicted small secreted protein